LFVVVLKLVSLETKDNLLLRRIPIGRISLMYPLTAPIGATSAWLVIDAEITLKIFVFLGIILIGTITPYIGKK